MSQAQIRVPLILGAGLIGLPGTGGRVEDPALAQEFVDVLVGAGFGRIDAGREYCQGTTEQLISSLDLRGKAVVDTKMLPFKPGDHAPEKIKAQFEESKAALGDVKIRVLYLHVPDRTVPFEDTLEALNDLHNAGEFEEIGLSNYTSHEVATIVGICERRGFVRPTVYQGVYNLIDRAVESELFPCLRQHGIRFAVYTALAGGYLTDRVSDPSPEGAQAGQELSHFDPAWRWASFYSGRYLASAPAVAELRGVVKSHGLSTVEVAYRWLQWHSKLVPGDHGVLVAPSKRAQLDDAIKYSAKGPLPDEVVQACEDTWKKISGVAPKQYWL